MSELKPKPVTPRRKMASVRAAEVSGAQWGVIGAGPFPGWGARATPGRRGGDGGRLHPQLPRVYAFGHASVPPEGRLVAALLYAGPGAALSHATAAWWWGLIPNPPSRVEVSTMGRRRSHSWVVVHHPREVDQVRHRRLAVTTVARTLLDFATATSDAQLRRALSEADYQGRLDLPAIHAGLGRGRPGSARMRRGLLRHEPRLARTRSGLERAFLSLCELRGIPLPEINGRIGMMTVDAVWRRERLVVEIDGYRGHRTPGQIERDRRRELHLRAAGYAVLRYTEDQLYHAAELVAADLRLALHLNVTETEGHH